MERTVFPWLISLPLLCGAASATSATEFDPALRFHVLATEHFLIYFHQDEDRLARRLGAIAEDTWHGFRQSFGVDAPPHTHVVLVDQADLANGSATPVPYNTIVVTAVWPAGTQFTGNVDDWLRSVFSHEFTHIVHLDRSSGWARLVRGVFGRTPIAFPNLFLPAWQTEGLATYQESVTSGEGRLHGGDFRAIVDEAARSRQIEPLDRVNSGLTDWPGGLAPYAYGAGFHAYLADRYGADRFATLAGQTAGRVPFTASRLFERVYGKSLGSLWRDYESSLATRTETPPAGEGATRLTHDGFVVTGPRFDREPCHSCPSRIIYSALTPHEFPALKALAENGSSPSRLATRYLGSTSAVGRDFIVFDQLELRRNAGLYSDLYLLDRRSRRVRRLTSDARLLDPDLSPDGGTLVCVRDAAGRRDLVLVRLPQVSAAPAYSPTTAIEVLVSEPETQFNAPRWSPDGRAIAVERHREGALSEVVLVDVAARSIRTIASDARARVATPAWLPDGNAVVAAVAPEDAPFNLYEFPLDNRPPRQLTRTTGGATWPDVAPDGKSIVFVGYTADGFDLFLMQYPSGDEAATRDFVPANPRADAHSSGAPETLTPEPRTGAAAVYRPWRTLKPTSWSPLIVNNGDQVRVGAATAGVDVLRYHAYAASATWQVTRPSGARAQSAAAPNWQIAYAYNRWRPTFWTAASRDTTFFAGPPTDDGVPSASTRRTDQFEAGVLLQIQHVRVSQQVLVSVLRASDHVTLPGRTFSVNRSGLRAAWALTSAHTYGYSVSPERGVDLGATAEMARRAFGSSANADTWTADARLYLPAVARHQVVALRLAAGASIGDPDLRRTFHLGGAVTNASAVDFGTNAISLLRGFGSNTFAGTHVALLNAEYRWPFARPQRGAGTWPLFAHTVHATAFADAGHTWTRRFDASDVKTSVGVELSGNLIVGYHFPLTATVGLARGHDPSGMVPGRWTIYLRLGRAF